MGKKAKTYRNGDWFQDVSEYGGNAKYILMCVDTPCKMGLISWPGLGPYAYPVTVGNVFEVTQDELNLLTRGTAAHLKQIPRPKRISVPQN